MPPSGSAHESSNVNIINLVFAWESTNQRIRSKSILKVTYSMKTWSCSSCSAYKNNTTMLSFNNCLISVRPVHPNNNKMSIMYLSLSDIRASYPNLRQHLRTFSGLIINIRSRLLQTGSCCFMTKRLNKQCAKPNVRIGVFQHFIFRSL